MASGVTAAPSGKITPAIRRALAVARDYLDALPTLRAGQGNRTFGAGITMSGSWASAS